MLKAIGLVILGIVIFFMLVTLFFFLFDWEVRRAIKKDLAKYDKRTIQYLYELINKMVKKIDKENAGVDKKIINYKNQIDLIPQGSEFDNLRESRRKILKEMQLNKELKTKKILEKYKKKIPVIIAVSKNKDPETIYNDKELMSIFKMYIKDKFKKENLIIMHPYEVEDLLHRFSKKVGEDNKLYYDLFIVLFENPYAKLDIKENYYKSYYLTKGE